MASLSGRDTYEPLDAAQLYHEHEDDYRALPPPLSSPQDGYAHGEYAYAPHHSSGASLSGKRIALFNSSKYPSHTTSPRYLSALRISFLLYSPLPARGCNSRNAGSLVLYVVKFPPMACSEANTITQLPLHVIRPLQPPTHAHLLPAGGYAGTKACLSRSPIDGTTQKSSSRTFSSSQHLIWY
jgi:hypothetical protein